MLFVAVASEVGGGNRSLLSLLQRLDRNRLLPIVACPAEGRLTELLNEHGVEWRAVARSARFSKYRPLPMLQEVGRYVRLIRQRRIRMVHVNDLSAWMAPSLAARFCRVPASCHVRCDMSVEFLRYLAKWCPCPSLLIANSEAMHRHMEPRFAEVGWGGRCTALPNAVDVERFTPAHHFDTSVPKRRPVSILFASNLAPCKGPDVFLRIAARVRSAGVDAVFKIAGEDFATDGHYDAELRVMAQRLGLGDCVSFLGFQDDMVDIYQGADILVWPAREYLKDHASTQSIGFPRVIIEALACGVPVVASNLTGVSEAIAHGETGILVPPGEEDSFAEAIINLVNDERQRCIISRAARERTVRDFSLESHVSRFERAVQPSLQFQSGTTPYEQIRTFGSNQ
jgi:glycosyltransferase involved in cell wall biosynthesis